MKEIALKQGQDKVVVSLRKSSRAKHVGIRINPTKQVELVIPNTTNVDQARKFLIKKQSWIFDKLREIKNLTKFRSLDAVPIFGKMHKIIHTPSSDVIAVAIKNDEIKINCPVDDIKEVLIEFLKSFFLKEVTKIAKHVAKQMKLSFSKIRITDATTKWGCCNANKVLSFHWRLVFAPQNVVYYIVVHEISHLKEMNHSKAFWELVGSIDSDYLMATKWLKKNASPLHAFLT